MVEERERHGSRDIQIDRDSFTAGIRDSWPVRVCVCVCVCVCKAWLRNTQLGPPVAQRLKWSFSLSIKFNEASSV